MRLGRVMMRDYEQCEINQLREDTHDISTKGGRFEVHITKDGKTRVVVRCREHSYTWIRCKTMGYLWCYVNV